MDRRDIQAFVERDWGLVAASKEAYWVERKRILGPSEGLRIAEDLLRQARLVRPEFPTAEDRQMDLASHANVSELFRKIYAQRRS